MLPRPMAPQRLRRNVSSEGAGLPWRGHVRQRPGGRVLGKAIQSQQAKTILLEACSHRFCTTCLSTRPASAGPLPRVAIVSSRELHAPSATASGKSPSCTFLSLKAMPLGPPCVGCRNRPGASTVRLSPLPPGCRRTWVRVVAQAADARARPAPLRAPWAFARPKKSAPRMSAWRWETNKEMRCVVGSTG